MDDTCNMSIIAIEFYQFKSVTLGGMQDSKDIIYININSIQRYYFTYIKNMLQKSTGKFVENYFWHHSNYDYFNYNHS